jgi:hypothetical protein
LGLGDRITTYKKWRDVNNVLRAITFKPFGFVSWGTHQKAVTRDCNHRKLDTMTQRFKELVGALLPALDDPVFFGFSTKLLRTSQDSRNGEVKRLKLVSIGKMDSNSLMIWTERRIYLE